MTIRIPKPVLVGGLFLIAVGVIAGLVTILGGGDDDGDSRQAIETSAEDAGSAKTTQETEPQTCDELGINREVQNEGACISEEGGDEVVVVNRDSTLRLGELTARLEDIDTTDTVSGGSEGFGTEAADGAFVTVRIRVKNLLNSPVTFDSAGQAVLTSRGKQFSEDFDAQNGPVPDSFLWQGEDIQPGASQSGAIVFDIPNRFAQSVEQDGNLAIFEFSDATRSEPKSPYGLIRLYPPSPPSGAEATTTESTPTP